MITNGQLIHTDSQTNSQTDSGRITDQYPVDSFKQVSQYSQHTNNNNHSQHTNNNNHSHSQVPQVSLNDYEYNQSQKKRCFTCKPRGKVKKHIIGQSMCRNYIFHHDMNHRPVILVTPRRHIENIEEIHDIKQLFKVISDFCSFWNIDDYQVSFNKGSWKINEHFHIKIKISDKIANRMRGDHFKRIKLEENYEKRT
jgi:hypothetical protein